MQTREDFLLIFLECFQRSARLSRATEIVAVFDTCPSSLCSVDNVAEAVIHNP